jgi:hypothetical protein
VTEHPNKYTFVDLSYLYATFKHALQDKNLHTYTMLNECKMCRVKLYAQNTLNYLSCSIKQLQSQYTPLQYSENKSVETCAKEGVDTQEGGISATLIVDVTTTARKKSLYQCKIKSDLS